jgi:hypothetical protein
VCYTACYTVFIDGHDPLGGTTEDVLCSSASLWSPGTLDVAQPSRPGLPEEGGAPEGEPGRRAFFLGTRIEEAQKRPLPASGGAGAAPPPPPPKPPPRPAGGSHCLGYHLGRGAGWWVTGATGRARANCNCAC